MNSSSRQPGRAPYAQLIAVAIGAAASAALVAFYLAVVSVANSPRHAVELLSDDKYFVAAIAAGFGTQMALYTHVRFLRARAKTVRATGALAAAGTGTSTVAMVACCAHHAVDVVPLLGLSGAAIFLNDYRIPIMVAGLAVNVAGIVVMLRVVRATRVQRRGLQLPVGGRA